MGLEQTGNVLRHFNKHGGLVFVPHCSSFLTGASKIILPTAIYGIQSYINSMKCKHGFTFFCWAIYDLCILLVDLPSPVPGIVPCNVEFTKSELYLDFIEILVIESGEYYSNAEKFRSSYPSYSLHRCTLPDYIQAIHRLLVDRLEYFMSVH